MKKLLFVLFLFLFIPVVNAETCENVFIDSIDLISKSDSVQELEEPEFSGMNLALNLKMMNVEDSIEYKMTIQNDSDSDYQLDPDSLNMNSDYMDYKIDSEDGSYIVPSKDSKDFQVTVQYINEVPTELFSSRSFQDNKTIFVDLLDVNKSINPKTGRSVLFIITFLLFILIVIGLFLIKSRNYKKVFILIGVFLIPVGIKALCTNQLCIESNINIVNPDVYTLNRTDFPLSIGETIPSDVTIYDSPFQAMEAWKDIIGNNSTRPYYLRHRLNSNNEIAESYVEFVIPEDVAEELPGLVAGTYSLRGGSEAYYEDNLNTVKTAFGYENNNGNCFDHNGSFYCVAFVSDFALNVEIYDYGYVHASDSSNSCLYYCSVLDDGQSWCEEGGGC